MTSAPDLSRESYDEPATEPDAHALEVELESAVEKRTRLEQAIVEARDNQKRWPVNSNEGVRWADVAAGLNDELRTQIGVVHRLRLLCAEAKARQAEADRLAASGASRDAIRWAKWAAIFTALAAFAQVLVALADRFWPVTK